ncbi:unnamed protein product [Caenorhabditis angaria]|uniref:Uncharacterized protein n=1 Tax=Caenorhabditis angaria TaxID=860376 RepID=A0A9P1J1L0_9PELO|nr:unnamed protein product [Caenorhabditis angaria]
MVDNKPTKSEKPVIETPEGVAEEPQECTSEEAGSSDDFEIANFRDIEDEEDFDGYEVIFGADFILGDGEEDEVELDDEMVENELEYEIAEEASLDCDIEPPNNFRVED